MTSRLLPAAVSVAVLVLCSAATAKPPDSARIVEHVSAGGVRIGMQRAAVLRTWGKATACRVAVHSWASNPGVEHCSWGTPDQWPSPLEVEFRAARVIAIHIRLIPYVEGAFTEWTTAKGIALGATPAAVSSAYGGELRQAAEDRTYGAHLYLSKQRGESVVETRFSLPQSHEREQVVRQIAIYDLKARFICGTVTGPRWSTRRGSSPSVTGTRYLVQLSSGYRKAQVRCAFARQWAAKLVRQRPRALYPSSGSSNFLSGPARPKKYVCSGQTGGRGQDKNFAFLDTGPWAILGSCYPKKGQSFQWGPDTPSDHDYDSE